jgi:hypothetical protein
MLLVRLFVRYYGSLSSWDNFCYHIYIMKINDFSVISDVHHSSRCPIHRIVDVQAVCFSK